MANPAAPVARQLDAYNARDIEGFMACWAPDCEYYAFPSTLLAQGAEAVRARHVERFQEPDLFGRLESRVVMGNLVVDRETVTRNFPEGLGEVEVLAIYEVEGGLIRRAWFSMGPRRICAPNP
jgi:putative hydrolase of HD superfamily